MDNLYTVVIPSASGILLILIISTIVTIAVRKRGGTNRGWKDVIEAVAYVTKTGLTVAYIPYKEDLFDDEQLFGGALTGIVSILGEITGETEVEMKVQTMEYGGKRLLVCSGIFGNAILLVSDVRPILKDLLMKFILEFELTYKFNLSGELLNLTDFETVPTMVESYFGVRKIDFEKTSEEASENVENFEEVTIIEEDMPIIEEPIVETQIPMNITDDTEDYTISYSESVEENVQDESNENEVIEFEEIEEEEEEFNPNEDM